MDAMMHTRAIRLGKAAAMWCACQSQFPRGAARHGGRGGCVGALPFSTVEGAARDHSLASVVPTLFDEQSISPSACHPSLCASKSHF